MKTLLLSDLPATGRLELLRRIEALGLQPLPWYGTTLPDADFYNDPPNSFHGEGIGWCKGTLLYREDCVIHSLGHEVGHLANLSIKRWRGLRSEDPGTSENVAMVVQVLLAKEIDGLGVDLMLEEMEMADYAFTRWFEGDISGKQWWESGPDRNMKRAWKKALEIERRWQQ